MIVPEAEDTGDPVPVILHVAVHPCVRREIKVRAARDEVRMQDLIRMLIYRGLGLEDTLGIPMSSKSVR